MSTINVSQITLDDALNDPDPLSFDAPVRTPQTARITCRVCARKEDVPILAAGLLCGHCRADLDATERHIRETLAVAEARFQDALTRWDADLAQADEADQLRYTRVAEALDKIAVARGKRTERTEVELKYARAIAKGDGLSAILRSKEACDDAATAVEQVRAWAERALEEVRAAR